MRPRRQTSSSSVFGAQRVLSGMHVSSRVHCLSRDRRYCIHFLTFLGLDRVHSRDRSSPEAGLSLSPDGSSLEVFRGLSGKRGWRVGGGSERVPTSHGLRGVLLLRAEQDYLRTSSRPLRDASEAKVASAPCRLFEPATGTAHRRCRWACRCHNTWSTVTNVRLHSCQGRSQQDCCPWFR